MAYQKKTMTTISIPTTKIPWVPCCTWIKKKLFAKKNLKNTIFSGHCHFLVRVVGFHVLFQRFCSCCFILLNKRQLKKSIIFLNGILCMLLSFYFQQYLSSTKESRILFIFFLKMREKFRLNVKIFSIVSFPLEDPDRLLPYGTDSFTVNLTSNRMNWYCSKTAWWVNLQTVIHIEKLRNAFHKISILIRKKRDSNSWGYILVPWALASAQRTT